MTSTRRARGFTMVEMMAVVAVIAILAMIALPSYTDRIVRAQVTDALPLADIAKAPVAAAWTASAPLPADNAAAGLPEPGKVVGNYVSAVTVDGGAIHITFGNRVNATIKGKTLTLRPAVVPDTHVVPVAWVCGKASVPTPMVAQGTDKTDVPAAYLPFGCR